MDDPMERVGELVDLISASKKHHFRMQWEGYRLPEGATIDGKEIYTQHGVVRGPNGMLGTYDWEINSGGKRGKYVMIIHTDYTDVAPPPGGTVEEVTRQRGGR
jgi:hypothetical protein